jgi:hypothetical protein
VTAPLACSIICLFFSACSVFAVMRGLVYWCCYRRARARFVGHAFNDMLDDGMKPALAIASAKRAADEQLYPARDDARRFFGASIILAIIALFFLVACFATGAAQ